MELMDALRHAIQDWVIPELDKLHLENAEIRTTLGLTNKRLDDIQQQLIDQSRRIDETNKRIDKVHDDLLARIDETNKRLDRLYEVIVRRDEHVGLEHWVRELDRKIDSLERRLAA